MKCRPGTNKLSVFYNVFVVYQGFDVINMFRRISIEMRVYF